MCECLAGSAMSAGLRPSRVGAPEFLGQRSNKAENACMWRLQDRVMHVPRSLTCAATGYGHDTATECAGGKR